MSSNGVQEILDSEDTELITTTKCKRKCVKKGDRICYSDVEGRQILKKIPDEENLSTSTHSLDSDTIQSGESVFKVSKNSPNLLQNIYKYLQTFTFDPKEDSPDMKKCMAFWNTVLEKNLKPIRCTFVEKQKASKKEKANDEANKAADDLKKLDVQNQLWIEAFKEIQKKKLNQVKVCVENDIVRL